MLTKNVDNLDRILDELEDCAQSNMPSAQFFDSLVEQLKITLQADTVVLLLPVDGGALLPIADTDRGSDVVQRDSHQVLISRIASSTTVNSLSENKSGEAWIAAPVRPANFSRGCLLVSFAQQIPDLAFDSFRQLVIAFAEIVAIRQSSELESFIETTWNRVQTLNQQIASSREREEATSVLVNGLAHTVSAARVSLVSRTLSGSADVQAISGVPSAISRTKVISSLADAAKQTLATGEPNWRRQTQLYQASDLPPVIAEDGLFVNYLCIPFSCNLPKSRPNVSALVFEFQSHAELFRCISQLPQVIPAVAITWEQQSRLLSVPRVVWEIATRKNASPLKLKFATKWITLLVVFFALLWYLRSPYPLVIEALGAYEPSVSRTIYASADGFVEALLVEDGESVKTGEPLLRLRSPTLELEIEKTQGEIRSLDEEVGSIRIAMNQFQANPSELVGDQSRLASQILQLQTQKTTLLQRTELLEQQRTRLSLTSPIDGVVVAKDLKQHLERRPVQRGETLFSISDRDGPWQIRVQVADHDSGYVLRQFMAYTPHDSPRSLDFVLDNSPDSRFQAQVDWIADHVENLHGEGCFVEVRATTDDLGASHAHAGAGVRAYFDCGDQPLWFVWCRPLIEAAQRRMLTQHYFGN